MALTPTESPPLEDKQPTSGYGSLDRMTKASSVDLYEDEYSDPIYQAKARILNHSIQEIGMGRYQVCGRILHRCHLCEYTLVVASVLRGRFWVVCVGLHYVINH